MQQINAHGSFIHLTVNCIVRAISTGLITALMLVLIVLLINGRAPNVNVIDAHGSCRDDETSLCFPKD